jgi:hypothetical protein
MSSFLYLGIERSLNIFIPTLVYANKGVIDFSVQATSLASEYDFYPLPLAAAKFTITPIGAECDHPSLFIALRARDVVLYQPFLQRLRSEHLIDQPLYMEAVMVLSPPLPSL